MEKVLSEHIGQIIGQTCQQGLNEAVFPGVSAACSLRCQGRVYREFFSGGQTRFDSLGQAIEKPTLFDLASLSKALCTSLLCLHLINNGQLKLDDDVFEMLELSTSPDKQKIRLHHLLRHASGLPAYKPFFQSQVPVASKGYKKILIQDIANQRLEYCPGTRSLYSDLGFILLGALVEKKAGMPLNQLFQQVITEPLGLANSLLFRPLETPSRWTEKMSIAATERCSWRQQVMQGEVDDEHCWLMCGVAGHAGLFGTAEAVLCLCELLLDIWQGRTSYPAFASSLLQFALNSREAHSEWALGFDRPTPGTSSSGRYFSPNSVGHLGFSGTSFWIDPEKECILVLLTNRIHPSRKNNKIKIFRSVFHDQFMARIFPDLA